VKRVDSVIPDESIDETLRVYVDERLDSEISRAWGPSVVELAPQYSPGAIDPGIRAAGRTDPIHTAGLTNHGSIPGFESPVTVSVHIG